MAQGPGRQMHSWRAVGSQPQDSLASYPWDKNTLGSSVLLEGKEDEGEPSPGLSTGQVLARVMMVRRAPPAGPEEGAGQAQGAPSPMYTFYTASALPTLRHEVDLSSWGGRGWRREGGESALWRGGGRQQGALACSGAAGPLLTVS